MKKRICYLFTMLCILLQSVPVVASVPRSAATNQIKDSKVKTIMKKVKKVRRIFRHCTNMVKTMEKSEKKWLL